MLSLQSDPAQGYRWVGGPRIVAPTLDAAKEYYETVAVERLEDYYAWWEVRHMGRALAELLAEQQGGEWVVPLLCEADWLPTIDEACRRYAFPDKLAAHVYLLEKAAQLNWCCYCYDPDEEGNR